MKVLLVGVGIVGEAIARLGAGRPWLERMVLADSDLDRARRVADSVGDPASHPVARIDASDAGQVEALARAHDVDLVMNAVDPRYLMPVFRGALAARTTYLDMAVSLVAMELLAEGAWSGAGVRSADAFDPDPYLAILDRDGIHHALIEVEPGSATA